MVKFCWLPFLWALSVHASIPSLEGLLRNGANPALTGGLIMLKGLVQKADSPTDTLGRKAAPPSFQGAPIHFKFLLSSKSEERAQLVQILYNNGQMRTQDLLHVRYFAWPEKEAASSFSADQGIFYGLLTTLGLNQASVMIAWLKKKYPHLRANREIVDRDKMRLLKKYKNYLKAIEKDPALKETLANPMAPKRSEEQARVDEIMRAPFLKHQGVVSLQREGERYYWSVDEEGYRARFDNQTHHLQDLVFSGEQGELKVYLSDYLTLNGRHQLPQYMLFQTSGGAVYRVRFTSLDHLNPSRRSRKSMLQRSNDYQRALGGRGRSASFLRPEFLSY